MTIPGPSKTTFLDGTNIHGGIKFVEIQKELFQLQNPTVNIRWNLGYLSGQIESKNLNLEDKYTRNFIYNIDQLNVKYNTQPSSQHGVLLNNVIRDINQNHFSHLLIIDPDFYIFSNNWISNLIEYMEKENLSIIGASYPEIDARMYFDFPTAYFSLIDTLKLPLSRLDYLPDENQFELNEELPWKYSFALKIGDYSKSKFRKLIFNRQLKYISSFFRWRNEKNFFRDTGWKIRERFKRSIGHEEFLFLDEIDLKIFVDEKNIFAISQSLRSLKRKLRKGVDVDWYREYYKDVKDSNLDPVYHYHKYGKFEGRIPALNVNPRVFELRPHLKIKLLARLEKYFSNEFSIDYLRKYSYLDFLEDHQTKFDLLRLIPKGVSYYLFFNNFFGMHFGHYAKQREPEIIRKEIYSFYQVFNSS